MMFYTGEDLTQKKRDHLAAGNGTLATLNEKKFQKRKSEKDMRAMLPMMAGDNDKKNKNNFQQQGRYFDEGKIFYRGIEHSNEPSFTNHSNNNKSDLGIHNLPDVVSGTTFASPDSMKIEMQETVKVEDMIEGNSSFATLSIRKLRKAVIPLLNSPKLFFKFNVS